MEKPDSDGWPLWSSTHRTRTKTSCPEGAQMGRPQFHPLGFDLAGGWLMLVRARPLNHWLWPDISSRTAFAKALAMATASSLVEP